MQGRLFLSRFEGVSMYKTGLVLEGGGLRSIFTSGVLDAFMENDIRLPYVIGVSAGSCNGVSYIAKNYQRMKDITLCYCNDERYMGIKSMIKNGEYLNSRWIFGELSYDLFPLDYNEFEKSGAVFCVVVTNALTGKAEYFYPTDFRDNCDEIKASCALPLATRPVKLGKDYYYDGGLVDSIPLERAYDDGCEKAVVILTQDRSYIKHPIGHKRAVKKVMKKYPLVAEKILDRHNMYNKQREFVFEQEKAGRAFIICPEAPLETSTLNNDKLKLSEIYHMGYRQGLENIDAVKEYLK